MLALAPAPFFIRRRAIAIMVAAPFALWLALLLTPLFFVTLTEPTATGTPHLRVVTANVLMSNDQLPALARDVLAQNPDVIVFEELRHELSDVAPELAEAYPYRISTELPWVTLASRFPLEGARLLPISADDRGRDLLAADIVVAGQRLTLVAVHFMPPLDGEAFAINRQQREVLERTVSKIDGPLLVLGDFNATSLSPTFARLLLGTGLRIASASRLMTPTYFAYGRLGVRIDHVLVRNVDVVRDDVFTLTGSDHRGLSVEVGLGPGTGSALAAAR
ncbi:MAG: hypothetical protein EPO16_03965 [Dehalococcoidia bacterium]|nr:MAG: hypothetical protein EPO16_03965 [Dehalococcoidia bacterium]